MVIKIARASSITRMGLRYFRHRAAPPGAAGTVSVVGGPGFAAGAVDAAGTGDEDIKLCSFNSRTSITSNSCEPMSLSSDVPRKDQFLGVHKFLSAKTGEFLSLPGIKIRLLASRHSERND